MYSNTEEEGKYIFGTEATYSCFSGFGLSISSTQTKTCVDDNNGIVGRFGGSEPTCERELLDLSQLCVHLLPTGITCSVLPSITNGTIDYPSGNTAPYYDYGTTATYQCNPGYNRTSGDSEGTCTGDGNTPSGQWDGIAPQCPRMLYNCDSSHPCHIIMYTYSCGLWDSSVYFQWISWDTNNHNIHRDSDLQL